MHVRSVACWVLPWLVVAIARADESRAWQVGRAAFAEGKQQVLEGRDGRAAFLRAMQEFSKLDAGTTIGPAQAQNLGNAAFLADDLPRAILAYRYGLLWDPHHSRLRENLAYARAQIRYGAAGTRGRPEAEAWPIWLPRLGVSSCASIVLIAYALACAALAVAVVKRKVLPVILAAAWLLAAVGAGRGWQVLHAQWHRDLEAPPVVIQADQVALRIGNGPSYPQQAELPLLSRGMEARRLASRGGWLQIQFASGEVGWIAPGTALTWEDLGWKMPTVR